MSNRKIRSAVSDQPGFTYKKIYTGLYFQRLEFFHFPDKKGHLRHKKCSNPLQATEKWTDNWRETSRCDAHFFLGNKIRWPILAPTGTLPFPSPTSVLLRTSRGVPWRPVKWLVIFSISSKMVGNFFNIPKFFLRIVLKNCTGHWRRKSYAWACWHIDEFILTKMFRWGATWLLLRQFGQGACSWVVQINTLSVRKCGGPLLRRDLPPWNGVLIKYLSREWFLDCAKRWKPWCRALIGPLLWNHDAFPARLKNIPRFAVWHHVIWENRSSCRAFCILAKYVCGMGKKA